MWLPINCMLARCCLFIEKMRNDMSGNDMNGLLDNLK